MSTVTIDKARAKQRIVETLLSISNDAEAGKLSAKPDTHPIRKVTLPVVEGTAELETADIASLLVERLEMQGFALVFDAERAQRTIDEAVSRIQGLQRP